MEKKGAITSKSSISASASICQQATQACIHIHLAFPVKVLVLKGSARKAKGRGVDVTDRRC
jgi:hypothetical protein